MMFSFNRVCSWFATFLRCDFDDSLVVFVLSGEILTTFTISII